VPDSASPGPSLLPVLKRNARAIVLDGHQDGESCELILIKRTRPDGLPPYWVTPGGGVEPEDPTILAAMHREVSEEIGGTVAGAVPVYVDTEPTTGPDGTAGVKVQFFFACRLVSMDPALRHGPEVEHPNGSYETVRVPFTREGIAAVDLSPASVSDYLRQNLEGVRALLAADIA
jgi:8-oxo-dGTP pyrophosphatase MutT (NUDIX family)